MSGPSPWLQFTIEALAACGTLLAVVVALVIAKRERAARERAEAEVDRLRARERRAEASKVTFSTDERLELDEVGDGTDEVLQFVTVRNDGELPVTSVSLHHLAAPADEPLYFVQLVELNLRPAAVTTAQVQLSGAVLAAPYALSFFDIDGVRWWRSESGELSLEMPPELQFWAHQRPGSTRE